MEDPRFAAYTTRPSTEKDVPEHIPYKLVRISVVKRPVDVTHISKEDPRYEFYASKNRGDRSTSAYFPGILREPEGSFIAFEREINGMRDRLNKRIYYLSISINLHLLNT
ncbi:uncharacterized protein LOC118648142 [Monomorium pharaonis]|uniref:uncharacterized protein LOC118648142 n=1 Tax=Monomorium pharaonis TaxID=307658 RepID=UPI001745E8F3|nr:uncharacterized protein LOC118648142 [Monomorium pharaonis]